MIGRDCNCADRTRSDGSVTMRQVWTGRDRLVLDRT